MPNFLSLLYITTFTLFNSPTDHWQRTEASKPGHLARRTYRFHPQSVALHVQPLVALLHVLNGSCQHNVWTTVKQAFHATFRAQP